MGGNYWEWTRDTNTTVYGTGSFLSLVTALNHPITGKLDDGVSRNTKDQFGPQGDYTSLSSGEDGGLGPANISYNVSGVIRNCRQSCGTAAGIFAIRLQNGVSTTLPYLGFRCVYEL